MNVILVGVDGTPSSSAAVEWATELAKTMRASLLAVHVVPAAWQWEMAALQVNTEPLIRARHLDLTGRWTEPMRRAGVEYTTHLLEGDPGKELLRIARRANADLIVIGGKPHGRVHDLVFGGTRHQLVTKSECPVVVVPTPSHVDGTSDVDASEHIHSAAVRTR